MFLLFQAWSSAGRVAGCGPTTAAQFLSSSTRPPWTCPTPGPSPCSASRRASPCRSSAGTWPPCTRACGTPPATTAPSTRTLCAWAWGRGGGRATGGSTWSAAPAGWRSCCCPGGEAPPPTLTQRSHFYNTVAWAASWPPRPLSTRQEQRSMDNGVQRRKSVKVWLLCDVIT